MRVIRSLLDTLKKQLIIITCNWSGIPAKRVEVPLGETYESEVTYLPGNNTRG